MMARGTLQRSSTLIDPAELQLRLPSQHTAGHGPGGSQEALRRRNSATIKPLLNFEEDNKTPGPRLAAGRSVFGVDTLWEREMVKLREIEAQERADEEEERRKEVVEDGKEKKKKKKQKRRGEKRATAEGGAELLAVEPPLPPRPSMEPPILPDIQRAPRRAPPQISDNDSDSDGSVEQRPGTHYRQHPDPNWHAISSDEDEPRRTTETGSRHPQNRAHHIQAIHGQSDDDDVPLSVAVPRVRNQASSWHSGKPNSDEGLLSTLHPKKQNNSLPDNGCEGDDDDRPLGLRVSRMSSQMVGDDDDQPLAYHPQQQRKTQYQMLAQQQQMLLQAQMQHNMYFPAAPPLMGTPFFAPPTIPMMMQAPMPSPIQDEVKFGRVDRWRHNVAVEGDQP